jgi:hypothetical protein
MAAAGAVLNLSSQAQMPAGSDRGWNPFDFRVRLDATDVDHVDDAILVAQFPSVAWIHNVDAQFSMAVLTDAELDTGTETLELDLAIGGVDGVADYLLISGNGSTIAEVGGAAGSTGLVAAASPAWIDVSDLYLQIIVRLASNGPADGDGYISGQYTQNIVRQVITSTNL